MISLFAFRFSPEAIDLFTTEAQRKQEKDFLCDLCVSVVKISPHAFDSFSSASPICPRGLWACAGLTCSFNRASASSSLYGVETVARMVARKPFGEPKVSFTAEASYPLC